MRTTSLLLLLAAPLAAQTPTPPSDAELVRRIEAYVAPLTGELSGTLLVARGDRILVERSFGFANHELRAPFTPSTPTNVASITKPLTIIIATQLMTAGKLGLNDTVSKWLPEFKHGPRITVTQLLGHRAGIPHRIVGDDKQGEPRTASDMVRLANDLPLLFEPGSQSVYSSGGFAILAAVLERASGKSYDELLQELIARPAGARTVRHLDQRTMLAGRAQSAIPAGDALFNAPLRDLSFLVGGGSVYTTPRDLHLVIQGVLKDKYGASARLSTLRPTGFAWNGITNGYRAFADYRLSDSLTVLFFGNTHVGAIDMMRRAIPEIATGATVPVPAIPRVTAVALSPATQARIAGSYDTGAGARAQLTFLSPSLALFGDRAMVALDDSTMFSFTDYARVHFPVSAKGTVEALQWGPGTWGRGELGPKFARVEP